MLSITVKPHRQFVMANSTDAQKLFVMFKLQPQASQLDLGTRPPVAIALVIDSSGSMASENKLGIAKEAAHQLVNYPALTAQDQMTIIQFEGLSHVLAPLTPVHNKASLHSAIDSMIPTDGTAMGLGMQDGLNELQKALGVPVKKMLLLTDGLTSDEDLCRQLAVRSSNESVPIVAFGVGVEYNQDLLLHMSEVSKGCPYHLTDMSVFAKALQDQLTVALKELVTNVRVNIRVVRGINVSWLRRINPDIVQIPSQNSMYHLGNVASDAASVFIAEMSLPQRQLGRIRAAQVEFAYDVPTLNKRDERVTADVIVEYTTDERRVGVVNPEVMGFVQQNNVQKMIDQAIQAAKTGQVKAALQTINAAKQMTQNLGNAALTQVLEKAVQELQQTGTISPEMVKTVKVDARTKTVKGTPGPAMSDAEIRKQSGT